MKNLESNLVIWHDDSIMASPEQDAKYPLTEEQRRRLNERLEKVFENFGLNATSSPETTANFSDATKYILEKQGEMSTRKLQKLCYYAQAWHFTWTGERLIKEDFQAWEHGPVCRELFKIHQGKYTIKAEEIDGDSNNLTNDQKDSIDIVLEYYGQLTSDELVRLTHSEEPYKKARGKLPVNAHSDNIITLESMREYYSKHLI